jgi:hypothetical protein
MERGPMRFATRLELVALSMAVVCLMTAGSASATVTTKGDNTITITLKTGTTSIYTGTFVGINMTVACTTSSMSATKDVGDAITGRPIWAGCSGTLAGAPITCAITTSGQWSLTSGASLGGASFSLSSATAAVTYTCKKDAGGTCTLQIAAQTVNANIVWTNAVPGTITVTKAPIKNINMAVDCIGISVVNVTGSTTAAFSSSKNPTVTLS